MSEKIHGEAFALMWYACPCGHRERIWNSRDGVTPFGGIFCQSCGRPDMQHVDWREDNCQPDHKLHPGQRYWRDGTVEEALRIIDKRVTLFAVNNQPIPADIIARLQDAARAQKGEWQKGWPMLDRQKEGL